MSSLNSPSRKADPNRFRRSCALLFTHFQYERRGVWRLTLGRLWSIFPLRHSFSFRPGWGTSNDCMHQALRFSDMRHASLQRPLTGVVAAGLTDFHQKAHGSPWCDSTQSFLAVCTELAASKYAGVQQISTAQTTTSEDHVCS